MSIRGSNFENQHPFASDHALVWERCMPDGLLYGVEMSFTPTLFTLGTGFMLVAGRMFEITAAENISISPGSGYARVYVAIDTGGTATENSFDQVSFGVDYAANLDSFAELTQGEININQGAAVYQAEVAVLAINSSGVTAIERQMELVSPGAGTGAFAAIGVTYPAGSTVTVTDGKITYTAPNTNGGALFIIPYAATWIVTATDGTETTSQTVSITTEGQNVSVTLSYLVPAEYQAVEYLESTGTQWILTDCYSNAQYSRFVGRGTLYLGAALWGAGRSIYSGFLYAAQAGVDAYPGSGILSNSIAYNADHDIDAEWKAGTVTAIIDGVTYNATFTGNLNTSTAIGLLKVNDSPTKNTVGKLYRCQLYSAEGVLSGDFIPCYRKTDSVAGMWDRVSEQFYTNAGTGTFILGADI